jgi:hypothetical protein
MTRFRSGRARPSRGLAVAAMVGIALVAVQLSTAAAAGPRVLRVGTYQGLRG